MKKVTTLVLLLKDDQVLLGLKKRGFGAGRWNGFGGKVEAGETIVKSAIREMKEECGVELTSLQKFAVVNFEWEGKPDTMEVNYFCATEYNNEPVESEEMKPQWFNINEIPFKEMWPDDAHWFPLFLAGKKFTGRFLFGPNDVILEKELVEVSEM